MFAQCLTLSTESKLASRHDSHSVSALCHNKPVCASRSRQSNPSLGCPHSIFLPKSKLSHHSNASSWRIFLVCQTSIHALSKKHLVLYLASRLNLWENVSHLRRNLGAWMTSKACSPDLGHVRIAGCSSRIPPFLRWHESHDQTSPLVKCQSLNPTTNSFDFSIHGLIEQETHWLNDVLCDLLSKK